MKYKEKNISTISQIIKSDDIIVKARKNDIDFTRKRKITVKDIIYYNLNKKGLSSKMELDKFIDICQTGDISSPGMLKQRKKLNREFMILLKDFLTYMLKEERLKDLPFQKMMNFKNNLKIILNMN